MKNFSDSNIYLLSIYLLVYILHSTISDIKRIYKEHQQNPHITNKKQCLTPSIYNPLYGLSPILARYIDPPFYDA